MEIITLPILATMTNLLTLPPVAVAAMVAMATPMLATKNHHTVDTRNHHTVGTRNHTTRRSTADTKSPNTRNTEATATTKEVMTKAIKVAMVMTKEATKIKEAMAMTKEEDTAKSKERTGVRPILIDSCHQLASVTSCLSVLIKVKRLVIIT